MRKQFLFGDSEPTDNSSMEEKKEFFKANRRTNTTLIQPSNKFESSDTKPENQRTAILPSKVNGSDSILKTSTHKRTQTTVYGGKNSLGTNGEANADGKSEKAKVFWSFFKKKETEDTEKYKIHGGDIQAVKTKDAPILFKSNSKGSISLGTSKPGTVSSSQKKSILEPIPENPVKKDVTKPSIKKEKLEKSEVKIDEDPLSRQTNRPYSPESLSTHLGIVKKQSTETSPKTSHAELTKEKLTNPPGSQERSPVTPAKHHPLVTQDSVWSKSTGQDLVSPELRNHFESESNQGSFINPFGDHVNDRSSFTAAVVIDSPMGSFISNTEVEPEHKTETKSEAPQANPLMETKQFLLNEYRELRNRDLHSKGIYIIPSPHDPLKIIGIVVIKSGFYDKGKFKFEINIPQGYPSQRFSIYFTTKVYHPLVNNETGELDITLLPVSDTPLADGLMFIRNIFVDTTYLNVPDSFNSTAYKNYNNKRVFFNIMAKDSVKLTANNTLDQRAYTNEEVQKRINLVQEKLKELAKLKDLSFDEKVKEVIENLYVSIKAQVI